MDEGVGVPRVWMRDEGVGVPRVWMRGEGVNHYGGIGCCGRGYRKGYLPT
jgi:hypothetical protein